MSIILANAEVLIGESQPTSQIVQRFATGIERNAGRLAELISDLLDIARIEAGQYAFERKPVDVRVVIDRVVQSFEVRAQEKHQVLRADVAPGLQVIGDERAVEQVIANLVENAVKYIPSGGLIQIRARGTLQSVRIEVEDDGPGVAAEHRDRLFERFYRVDAGRARDRGGTGLGLAIVKHLVEGMGGTVGIEPATPTGVRVWCELARAPET